MSVPRHMTERQIPILGICLSFVFPLFKRRDGAPPKMKSSITGGWGYAPTSQNGKFRREAESFCFAPF